MMQHTSNDHRCLALHRQIYDLLSNTVAFYEKAKRLGEQNDPIIVIPSEHKLFYTVQSYLLNVNQINLKIVDDDKEEELLLQTRHKLLTLRYEMIDSVNRYFRAAFARVQKKYQHEKVGLHIDIQQFRKDSADIENIISDSKNHLDNPNQLYLSMAKIDAPAEKMVHNFALLKDAESPLAKAKITSLLRVLGLFILAPIAVILITDLILG